MDLAAGHLYVIQEGYCLMTRQVEIVGRKTYSYSTYCK